MTHPNENKEEVLNLLRKNNNITSVKIHEITGIPERTIRHWRSELRNESPIYENPKVLYWDIETSLMLATIWRTGKQYVGINQISQDWFIHCVSYAWGSGKVKNISQIDDMDRFKNDVTDDYHVVKYCWDMLDKADIIVHHNGNRFDYPKLLARAIFHRLPPINQPMFIDTCNLARKAGFTSKALSALGIKLSLDSRKSDSKYEWWKKTLEGNIEYHKKMRKYCNHDITPMRDLLDVLKPYFPRLIPNINLFTGDKYTCTILGCGGELEVSGQTRKGKTMIVQNYKCTKCGAYSNDGKNLRKGNIVR